MQFEKLPPLVVRPEMEEVDIEIWQPHWNCFCCHDSGIVKPHLASLVIEGYDWDKHKLPLCQKPGCSHSSRYSTSQILSDNSDARIKPLTCKKLDEFERETWRKTMFVHGQRIREETEELAREKSLRYRNRTHLEQQYAEERHRQVAQR